MNIFFTRLFSDPVLFFTVIVTVSFSVCLHEFFHAYTAYKCGDSTAAEAGHLTLNPLKQMGLISIVMLLLLGFCWGSVPVNPARLTRRSRIMVALAGPLTNLMLFVISIVLAVLAVKAGSTITGSDNAGEFAGAAARVLVVMAQFNFVLFCINIAPVPGLDGGAVLFELLPMQRIFSSELGKGIVIGLALVLFCCLDYVFMASEAVTRICLNGLWDLFQ